MYRAVVAAKINIEIKIKLLAVVPTNRLVKISIAIVITKKVVAAVIVTKKNIRLVAIFMIKKK